MTGPTWDPDILRDSWEERQRLSVCDEHGYYLEERGEGCPDCRSDEKDEEKP